MKLGCSAIFANCASANFLALSLAAFFSAGVKSVRASIAFSLSANAFVTASFASSFPTGFTFAISPVPAVLA